MGLLMYLEKLPKEGLEPVIEEVRKRQEPVLIYDLCGYKGAGGKEVLIEAQCSSSLIHGFFNDLDDWLEAFAEHYENHTKQKETFSRFDGIMERHMIIPSQRARIMFEVDTHKRCLRFKVFYNNNEDYEETRDIVYSFIDRIWDNDIRLPN